jgi:hypothetical protein
MNHFQFLRSVGSGLEFKRSFCAPRNSTARTDNSKTKDAQLTHRGCGCYDYLLLKSSHAQPPSRLSESILSINSLLLLVYNTRLAFLSFSIMVLGYFHFTVRPKDKNTATLLYFYRRMLIVWNIWQQKILCLLSSGFRKSIRTIFGTFPNMMN